MTPERFTAEILESDLPVLVDFSAGWCPPCRIMRPVLEQLAADRPDLRVVEVDIDDSLDVAVRYGILSAPTFMVFRHGEPVLSLIGARPRRRLEPEIDAVLAAAPVA